MNIHNCHEFGRILAVLRRYRHSSDVVTSSQCAAARNLLGWSVRDLAQRARLSPTTVSEFETGRRQIHRATAQALRLVLEQAGITITPGETVDPHARNVAITLEDGTVVALTRSAE